MNVSEFRRWVATARPGERLLYHQGDLMRDRGGFDAERRGKAQRDLTEAQRNLSRLADEVRDAQEAGFVTLVQKRVDEGVYHYFAERTMVGR